MPVPSSDSAPLSRVVAGSGPSSPADTGADAAVETLGMRVEWAAVRSDGEDRFDVCGVVERFSPAHLTPGTRIVAVARGPLARRCFVSADSAVRVPPTLDPSLAVLARPLAVSMHSVAQLARTCRRVLFLGYSAVGALMHVELCRRLSDPQVTVVESAPLRAALARALGAAVRESPARAAASHDRFDVVVIAGGNLADGVAAAAADTDIVLLEAVEPTTVLPLEILRRGLRLIAGWAPAEAVRDALDQLADETWRYVPVITDAVSLRALPAQTAELRDAVAVLVRP